MTTIEQLYKVYLTHPVITTDTRNCPAGSLFFALKGERFNGNQFAAKALETGSAFAIIDEPEFAVDEHYIVVTDVLSTLQELAKYHRNQLSIPIIGITGTNGKTTTKELVRCVLSKKYNTLATEGNLNNHIGVPLTLLKITPAHEMAIIEMGANHPGEIRFLCAICRPDYGLITNVGKAHLEGFGSLEGVIKTKSELYESLRATGGKTFLDAGNQYLPTQAKGLESILYGEQEGLFVSGKLVGCSPFVSFQFTTDGSTTHVNTQLIGSYNMANLLAAVAVGRYFGVPATEIKNALEAYTPANKRSQLIRTQHNTLILDAYNANPTSMMAALQNFRDMEAAHKTLILGGMRELGSESSHEHRQILDFLIETGFESVILVGDEFNSFEHPFGRFASSAELKEWLSLHPLSGELILIKGSRGIALENIIDAL